MISSTIAGLFAILFAFSPMQPVVSEEFEKSRNDLDINCTQLLESYANASASFTYCAVKYARPIRICERCVELYQVVEEAHKKILQVEDGSGNKRCKEQLMNLDRLEVIEAGFTFIQQLWDRAACTSCFELKNTTLVLANNTIIFMEKLNITQDCFRQHEASNETYSEEVCQDCESKYCDMNKFYDNLKNKQDNVCMDIVDSMNITRMMWNDKLMCKKDTGKIDIIFLATSGTMAALPVVFYLGAKLFSTVIRNRLQMQKRLAEILRPSTSTGT